METAVVLGIIASALSIIVSLAALSRANDAVRKIETINLRLSASPTITAGGNVQIVQQVRGNVTLLTPIPTETSESLIPPLEATGESGN